MSSICVVTDNENLKPLLIASEGSAGHLPLTTIREGQKRAHIRLYQIDDTGKRKLYELTIDNLGESKPEIDLDGICRGGAVHLTFLLNGAPIKHVSLPIHEATTVKRPWWLLAPAVLIAAALVFLLFPDEAPPPAPANGSFTIPSDPVESSTIVEPPSAVIVEALEATVYFSPNSAVLLPDTQEALLGLAEELSTKPEWRVQVSGHCALAGTEQGRIELSWERAQMVSSYLLASGWSPQEAPVLTGFGGKMPVTVDEDLQHLNRRVEILGLPKLDHPVTRPLQ